MGPLQGKPIDISLTRFASLGDMKLGVDITMQSESALPGQNHFSKSDCRQLAPLSPER
jgi:hypothetical protein